MNDVLLKKLIDFGLSDKEARIYLALLALETATAFEIAKQAGINRSSTYVVLESLKKQGLVGVSDDKKVRQYVAASPDTLLHTAETAAEKQTEIKEGIESVVPELKALHRGAKGRPIVKVFEGVAGIREIFYDIFSDKTVTEFRVYADASKMFKLFPEFVEYNYERAARGIKMYAINPSTKGVLELLKKHPLPQSDKMALIPEKKFKFPVNVGIWGNKVGFISMEGEFGIIIESKDIAETFRNSFDLSWEEANRLDKDMLLKTGKTLP